MMLAKDIQVYVKANDSCNLNCKHCYTSGSNGRKRFFDSQKTADFLIQMTRAHHVQNTRLLYHGGEPMLAPLADLWDFYYRTKDSILNVEYGLQTNLVYPLTEEKINFFETVIGEVGIGTSWDPDIRFGSNSERMAETQLKLWETNVRTLTSRGLQLTLMVCLSKTVVEKFEPHQILQYAIDLGFKYILFERITDDGNTQTNSNSVLPLNRDLDQWILRMYLQTQQYGFQKKIGNMFLEEIANSVLNGLHTANRCRNCETKIVTINADGSLAGCPNSAPEKTWGHIDSGVEPFITSNPRVAAICKEKMRNPICMTCDVSHLCNGDCYKLKWDQDVCSAPKSLMRYLKDQNQREFVKDLII